LIRTELEPKRVVAPQFGVGIQNRLDEMITYDSKQIGARRLDFGPAMMIMAPNLETLSLVPRAAALVYNA
jgi:hypothetical protein